MWGRVQYAKVSGDEGICGLDGGPQCRGFSREIESLNKQSDFGASTRS